MTNPEAGWYPDPENAARMRYFDGEQWTEHYHDGEAQAATGSGATATPAARPGQLTDAGALLSQAWGGVRARIGLLLGVTAAAIAASLLLGLLGFAIIASIDDSSSSSIDSFGDIGVPFVALIALYIAVYAIWAIWGLMSSRIMLDHFRGVEPSFQEAWDTARSRCLAFFRGWFGVIVIAYVGFAISALILASIHPVALVLMIAPLLFFWVKTAFLSTAAIATVRTEDLVVASTDLSTGSRFMPILGRLLMLALPSIALLIVLFILGSADAPPALALIVMVVGGFIAWSIMVAGTSRLYIEAGGSMSRFNN